MRSSKKVILVIAAVAAALASGWAWRIFSLSIQDTPTSSDAPPSQASAVASAASAAAESSPEECGVNKATVIKPMKATIGADKTEVIVSVCEDYDSVSSPTHLVDFRSISGKRLHAVRVTSSMPADMFGISLEDVDGDGFTDLVVRTGWEAGEPYIPVDVYFYDAEARDFQLGERFMSSPTLTATPGCVVIEYRIRSAGMFADRECFIKQEKKWQTEATCQLGDDACPEKLKH